MIGILIGCGSEYSHFCHFHFQWHFPLSVRNRCEIESNTSVDPNTGYPNLTDCLRGILPNYFSDKVGMLFRTYEDKTEYKRGDALNLC